MEPEFPDLPVIPEGVDPLEATRLLASAYLPQIISVLASRGYDDRITTPNLISISEHLYKVSGMAAKQNPVPLGSGFSIQIVLGDGAATGQTITIGGGETIEHDALPAMPAFMQARESGNLEALV